MLRAGGPTLVLQNHPKHSLGLLPASFSPSSLLPFRLTPGLYGLDTNIAQGVLSASHLYSLRMRPERPNTTVNLLTGRPRIKQGCHLYVHGAGQVRVGGISGRDAHTGPATDSMRGGEESWGQDGSPTVGLGFSPEPRG